MKIVKLNFCRNKFDRVKVRFCFFFFGSASEKIKNQRQFLEILKKLLSK